MWKYWRIVIRRAAWESLDSVGLTTPIGAIKALALPVVVFGGLYAVFNEVSRSGISTAGALLILAFLIFATKLISLPHTLSIEAESRHRSEVSALRASIGEQQTEQQQEFVRYASAVVSKLRQLYITSEPFISSEIFSGIEMPPSDWMNGKLEQMREPFRVANAGHQYRILPLVETDSTA